MCEPGLATALEIFSTHLDQERSNPSWGIHATRCISNCLISFHPPSLIPSGIRVLRFIVFFQTSDPFRTIVFRHCLLRRCLIQRAFRTASDRFKDARGRESDRLVTRFAKIHKSCIPWHGRCAGDSKRNALPRERRNIISRNFTCHAPRPVIEAGIRSFFLSGARQISLIQNLSNRRRFSRGRASSGVDSAVSLVQLRHVDTETRRRNFPAPAIFPKVLCERPKFAARDARLLEGRKVYDVTRVAHEKPRRTRSVLSIFLTTTACLSLLLVPA